MNKKNVRKSLIIAASLVLAAAISVGATLAYLTAKTDPVTNTFTAGEGIDILLEEPSFNTSLEHKYLPGQTFAKDPQVQNTSSGSPVYVVASLAYYIGGLQVNYATFTNSADSPSVKTYAKILDSNDVAGFNTGWTKIADSDENVDYFVYGTITTPTSLAQNATTLKPVFSKVKISEKDTAGTKYEIKVNAYAVNADGGVSNDVFTELDGLTGNKLTLSDGHFTTA